VRLLLDTHVLLWWLLRDRRLSTSALALLTDPANDLLLSSVSGFQIASKVTAGKLKLPAEPEVMIEGVPQLGNLTELPLALRHTYRVAQLPPIHGDPFDRLLISTALAEALTLLTNDPYIRAYPVATVW
jgi:PIN domain nuclease of toxin-antitoxin system